jgi:hypothetical protein
MREQRDRIVAMKKAEREKKVKAEEDAKAKNSGDSTTAEAMLRAQIAAQKASAADAKGGESAAEVPADMSEQRRSAMRLALARRMKMDLIDSEESRVAQAQEDQFADLDRKLKQVEQMRQENKQREFIIAEQLKRQQAVIAKNMKKSAEALTAEDM